MSVILLLSIDLLSVAWIVTVFSLARATCSSAGKSIASAAARRGFAFPEQLQWTVFKSSSDTAFSHQNSINQKGMPCYSVNRDADFYIIKATVEQSHHCTTMLQLEVGENTDLLILLLHYSRTDYKIIYFPSDANKQLKEHRVYM